MEEIIIKIHKTTALSAVDDNNEEGYMYDIYENESALKADKALDGGFCTTTMVNVLDMAQEQAQSLIMAREGKMHFA